MKRLSVPVVYAFVDGDRGGNAAGVVLDAKRFSPKDRQHIAACVGLSETAFVSPANGDGFHVEFFTPTRQIADCGHATVATFSFLAQQGRIESSHSIKELADGTVRTIDLVGDRTFMAQSVPHFTLLTDDMTVSDVLASLALTPDDLFPNAPLLVGHNGVNGLFIPVRDADTLARLVPDMAAISAVSKALDLVEYYVFSPETRVPGRDAGARMFAPRYGIPEEAATGLAAGPLACYLHDFLGIDKPRLVIEQGFFMTPTSPCELVAELTLEAGKITALRVGGRARVGESIEVS